MDRLLSTVLFLLSAAFFQQCEQKSKEAGQKRGDELKLDKKPVMQILGANSVFATTMARAWQRIR